MKDKLIVSPAPHVCSVQTTSTMMFVTIIALLPMAIYGVINLGLSALWVILVSVGGCYVLDVLMQYVVAKRIVWLDLSSIVTGLMLALILPVKTPLYVVAIGAFIAIVVFKHFFGGLGKNVFNPAAIARLVLGLIFVGLSLELYKGSSLGPNVLSPIEYFMNGDYSSVTLQSLFLGNAPGGLGSTSIVFVLLCGIILMCFKITDYIMPIGSIVAFVITIWIGKGAIAIVPYAFSGSFLFVTMFMLSDPTTSPNTSWGKLISSLLFGLLAGIFRVNFVLGETSVFLALIIVNFLSGLLDKVFIPRPLGVRRISNEK